MELILFALVISPILAIPAEYEYSPPRRFYFNDGELLVADELKNEPENSEYYNPPVRYWRFSYETPKPEIQQPENRYERNWHHPVDEFEEYYSQHQPKEIYSMGPYIFTNNRKRGPPSGYSHYLNAEDINVVAGHNHHRVTVLPSHGGGHRIRVYPEHSGHKIVVGNKHYVIHRPSNSELDMETTKFEMPNEIIPTVKPIKKPIKKVTKDEEKHEEKHDCFMNSCEWEHDPLEEGSADFSPLHESLLGNGQSLNDLDAPMLNDAQSPGSKDLEISRNKENSNPFLGNLFSNINDIDEKPCITPNDEPGHCRHFRDCPHPRLVTNDSNEPNECLDFSLGVCCPDDLVVEATNPGFINTNETKISLESMENCGTNPKTDIVDGVESDSHEWTWMVALLRKGRFLCGGVLINNLYVLTTVHCVMGLKVKDLTIRLGGYDFNEAGTQKIEVPVAKIKPHEKFSGSFEHDIALLKLRHSVKLNRFIGTICLPKAGIEFVGVDATVLLWRKESFGGSPILRQVTSTVWDNRHCAEVTNDEELSNSLMCAGSPKECFDYQLLDQGGPLMSLNGYGRWQVIGLVILGPGCGDPHSPGIYTSVTPYLDWIDQNMKPKS